MNTGKPLKIEKGKAELRERYRAILQIVEDQQTEIEKGTPPKLSSTLFQIKSSCSMRGSTRRGVGRGGCSISRQRKTDSEPSSSVRRRN
ncbi:hypothetical protein YC2023_122312 [Brassica napus]